MPILQLSIATFFQSIQLMVAVKCLADRLKSCGARMCGMMTLTEVGWFPMEGTRSVSPFARHFARRLSFYFEALERFMIPIKTRELH